MNKVKMAAVLAYKQNDGAPKLIGKGHNEMAERLIEQAKLHNIPIAQSSELVSMLVGLNLDQEIPPELYQAVATVLHWAYALKRES